jgi:hypothetical protein
MKDLDFIDDLIENDWRLSPKRFEYRKMILGSMIRQGVSIKSHVYEFCDHAISQGYGESYVHLSTESIEKADTFLQNRYKEWTDHVL